MITNNFADGFQPQPRVNTALPSIQSLTHTLFHCPSPHCNNMYNEAKELQLHQKQSPGCRGLPQMQPHPQQQRGVRHDSMHSIHSVQTSPSGWSTIPGRINTQLPSSSSSAASDSDEMCYTPDVSRASSVSRSYHGSRRTSRVDIRAPKRHRRQSPAPLVMEENKKAKKTEKEKLNRSNQAAVMFRMEDSLEHYIGWSKQEQSGGNGNSAGLSANKINLLRGWEAVSNQAFHKLRCMAIKDGKLNEFQQEYQAIAEAACEDNYQPFSGTFLQLAPGEIPCRHEDTKAKNCSAHNHDDWRECRKFRAEHRFSQRENAYIASLGMNKQQALYGSRAALPTLQGRPQVLPHRHAKWNTTSQLHA